MSHVGEPSAGTAVDDALFLERYQAARQAALDGDTSTAEDAFQALLRSPPDAFWQAVLSNDLACLAAIRGDMPRSLAALETTVSLDPGFALAHQNLTTVRDLSLAADSFRTGKRARIAVLSLLFNWPSHGGGTVHTAEAGRFLTAAGHTVRHFFARYEPWGIGRIERPPPVDSQVLEFDRGSWCRESIQQKFREAVREFSPDMVLVTGSWSCKPILAEAVADYPYVLRFGAQECLCPLNNVRLLVAPGGQSRQCENDQLTDPGRCRGCIAEHGHTTGGLHRVERTLAGFDEPDYVDRLRRVLQSAHAVFVVNPDIAGRLAPHAINIRVVPSGFDLARFPAPPLTPPRRPGERKQILFAGLVEEWMKGFLVLRAACAGLWRERQDFELIATADPPGPVDEFTRYIGWQSQEQLPMAIAAADLLAFPTIAQEGLGRSVVEAMGCGRPVVASRIGGLAWVVEHERTGLLCRPGDAEDLSIQLRRLLDDAELRQRLGDAGREKFEREFTWDVLLARHYEPVIHQALVRGRGQ